MNLYELQRIIGELGQVSVAQFSVVAEGNKPNAFEEKISNGIQSQLVRQIANFEFNVLGKLQALVLPVTAIVLLPIRICVTTTMMAFVTADDTAIVLRGE